MQEIKRHSDSALTFFRGSHRLYYCSHFPARDDSTHCHYQLLRVSPRNGRFGRDVSIAPLSRNRSVRPILSVRTSPVRARDPGLRTA